MKRELVMSSTNGRWGVKILVDENLRESRVIQGDIKSLGSVNNFKCFEIINGDHWIIIGDDLHPISGCALVVSMDLQSSSSVTILRAISGAIWKWTGYKGRSSGFNVISSKGEVSEAKDTILLAAGLVSPREDSVIQIPEILPVSSSLQEALIKAGLVKPDFIK